MGSIYHSARLDVPADVAWDYLDRFTRAEVIPFSAAIAGRREGEHRVVTMPGGHEIWERNVTIDPVHRRTSTPSRASTGPSTITPSCGSTSALRTSDPSLGHGLPPARARRPARRRLRSPLLLASSGRERTPPGCRAR